MKKKIENLIINNNITEAKNIILNEINNNPNNPQLYLMLGTAYSVESNFELAVQYYNKAFELAPNDYDVISTICNFLIASNCKQDANDIMESYIERQQNINENKKDFSYFDFILGDGDAINYDEKKQNDNIKKEIPKQTQNDANLMQNDDIFSYKDLIFSDISDVLEKHNLEPTPRHTESTPRHTESTPRHTESTPRHTESTPRHAELVSASTDKKEEMPKQVRHDANLTQNDANLTQNNAVNTLKYIKQALNSTNIIPNDAVITPNNEKISIESRSLNTEIDLKTSEINLKTSENDLKTSENDLKSSEITCNQVKSTCNQVKSTCNQVDFSIKTPTFKPKITPNILFVSFGWNETGGGVALPKSISKELAKRGYNVAVFYAALEHPTNKTPYYLEESADDGVRLFGLYNRPAPLYDFDNPLREIYDENVIRAFNSVIDKVNPNIVNIHNLHGLTLEIASIIKKRGIVSTFTTYNYHLIDPKGTFYNNTLEVWKSTDFFANSDLPSRFPHLREGYKKRIDKCKELILNDIDYVFAVSNRVRDIFLEFVGDTASNKICVMNQLLSSVQQFEDAPVKERAKDNTLRVAYIGYIVPHKGIHIIAQALQYISNPNIKIDIYGDSYGSSEINDYTRAIKQFDRNNVITFCGSYSASDLRKIGENYDIMIVPSIYEDPAPIVFAESLSMCLPVIASKIGGAEDFIIDGFNGITYSAHNPKALASVITMLLENPYKIPQLKANVKLPYTFDTYITHLENVIIRLVNGERPSASDFDLRFRDCLQSNTFVQPLDATN